MSTAAATPLPAEIMSQLSTLRDIKLPEPVSWWPIAPGWWLVFAVLVLAAALYLLYRQMQKRSLRQAALRELSQLRAEADITNPQDLATAVSVLVRRVALGLPGNRHVANLHGQDWGEFLTQTPAGMPEPIANTLALAPYASPLRMSKGEAGPTSSRTNIQDCTAILAAAETWIRRHA